MMQQLTANKRLDFELNSSQELWKFGKGGNNFSPQESLL